MARNRKKVAEAAPSNSLVASAARYGGKVAVNFTKTRAGNQWHEQAWAFYDTIGEYRYSCDWVGSMLSKAILHATVEQGGSKKAVHEGKAADFITGLFGDSDGRAEMLRLIGIHMTVTGECWIVGWPDENEDGDLRDEWRVTSSTGLSRLGTNSGAWVLDGETLDVAEDQVMAIRIWRPHPKRPLEAVSPTRAILPILEEIFRLTEHVAAQVDSRLAGAGILLMPSEMQFPSPPAQEGDDKVQRVANNAEDLMGILQEAMSASINNRSDASALVPIVVTAPADAIAAVKHMTFWSELDEHAIELRNEAIRRLALGMDMPPEVLQGISESNHWSAWQADESAIKSHTEPLLKMITTAIASGFLRPLMRDELRLGGDLDYDLAGVEAYSVGADTADLRLRPNRSKEALELYNLGALSVKALRRETGFEEDDAMDKKEYAVWLLQKVAGGSATPEMVEAAMRALDVPIGEIENSNGGETNETRPDPSLKDHPSNDIPDQELGQRRKDARQQGNVPSATDVQHASLIAGAEQMVIRALERSGNKLKNRMQSTSTIAAFQLYRIANHTSGDYDNLLDDAWAHVPALAQRTGVSALALESCLDQYCRGLFSSKEAHTFEGFSSYMDTSMELMGVEL